MGSSSKLRTRGPRPRLVGGSEPALHGFWADAEVVGRGGPHAGHPADPRRIDSALNGLEVVAREAEEAAYVEATKQRLERDLEQQLEHLRRETEADWMAKPEPELRAELDKLRPELTNQQGKMYVGDAESQAIARWEARVLEVKIEILTRLADELDIEPGPESPSVIVGRWWKQTRQGTNTKRLAELALPYARRGTEHDYWVVETVLSWLWASQDDAADFARYFVKGLGKDRDEVFARMSESRNGRAALRSSRLKLDKDLVFGTGAEQLWGRITGEQTTEEINAEMSGAITETLGDEFSQEQLKARIEAGEKPALELTLGALTTPIHADGDGDSIRITASIAAAREVGVPSLMGTGLYVDHGCDEDPRAPGASVAQRDPKGSQRRDGSARAELGPVGA